jgi:hypothetical protein
MASDRGFAPPGERLWSQSPAFFETCTFPPDGAG